MTIPGIDGAKMSKSLNNYIDVFLPEKELFKQIKKIVTDTTALEDSKDPDHDITFKLYQLMASPSEIAEMRANYVAGGYGYGHAKQALLNLMLQYFKDARENLTSLCHILRSLKKNYRLAKKKVKPIAEATIARIRAEFKF